MVSRAAERAVGGSCTRFLSRLPLSSCLLTTVVLAFLIEPGRSTGASANRETAELTSGSPPTLPPTWSVPDDERLQRNESTTGNEYSAEMTRKLLQRQREDVMCLQDRDAKTVTRTAYDWQWFLRKVIPAYAVHLTLDVGPEGSQQLICLRKTPMPLPRSRKTFDPIGIAASLATDQPTADGIDKLEPEEDESECCASEELNAPEGAYKVTTDRQTDRRRRLVGIRGNEYGSDEKGSVTNDADIAHLLDTVMRIVNGHQVDESVKASTSTRRRAPDFGYHSSVPYASNSIWSLRRSFAGIGGENERQACGKPIVILIPVNRCAWPLAEPSPPGIRQRTAGLAAPSTPSVPSAPLVAYPRINNHLGSVLRSKHNLWPHPLRICTTAGRLPVDASMRATCLPRVRLRRVFGWHPTSSTPCRYKPPQRRLRYQQRTNLCTLVPPVPDPARVPVRVPVRTLSHIPTLDPPPVRLRPAIPIARPPPQPTKLLSSTRSGAPLVSSFVRNILASTSPRGPKFRGAVAIGSHGGKGAAPWLVSRRIVDRVKDLPWSKSTGRTLSSGVNRYFNPYLYLRHKTVQHPLWRSALARSWADFRPTSRPTAFPASCSTACHRPCCEPIRIQISVKGTDNDRTKVLVRATPGETIEILPRVPSSAYTSRRSSVSSAVPELKGAEGSKGSKGSMGEEENVDGVSGVNSDNAVETQSTERPDGRD